MFFRVFDMRKAIFMFVSFSNFVVYLTSFPVYVNVGHFSL
jgi:hypothetical protein